VTPITKPGESTTLTRASAQWRSRPADERFSSMEALHRQACIWMSNSHEFLMPLRDTNVEVEDDEVMLAGARMSNWAFGQFCSRIKAPASYLRTLPAPLAQACINNGIASLPDEQAKVLVNEGRIHGFTSERYVRIWNAEMSGWILDLQERAPHWTFPEAFRTANGQKENAWGKHEVLPVAFLSDRDMFVFLCDYEHPVTIPGVETPLLRGFWVENSETGAGAVRITLFLFDFVCCNVLVWGARNVIEVKVNHTGRARERVLFDDGEAVKAISAYANRATAGDVSRIVSARKALVADTRADVVTTLYGQRLPGLSKGVIDAAYTVAERTPRYGDPRSVWAMINGLTEVSQNEAYADARIEIDRSAGRLLDAYVPNT
jgi:hypothetical protein